MTVAAKVTRPFVAAEISRLTFIPARKLRPTDKLGAIGLNRVLKAALAEHLKASLSASQVDLDLRRFSRGVRSAKTVDDVVSAAAAYSAIRVGSMPTVLPKLAPLSTPQPIPRLVALGAVVASMKKQLDWSGDIDESSKLSKWKYTPIMRAQLAALINNYFTNELQKKLYPPMAQSHIATAEYVSEVVTAVDEKQTLPKS